MLCLPFMKRGKKERSSERIIFFLLEKLMVKHMRFERKKGAENCWDKEKSHTLCELHRKLISALNILAISSEALAVHGSPSWILPNKFYCGKKALENNMCI